MEINKQIKIMIEELTGNNIPCTYCVVTRAYQGSALCDIKTAHGNYKMVDSSREASVDDTGVLVFLDGDMSKPYVIITTPSQGGGGGVVMIGSFEINEDGCLMVTLPSGTVNPYRINEQGYLLYDTGA